MGHWLHKELIAAEAAEEVFIATKAFYHSLLLDSFEQLLVCNCIAERPQWWEFKSFDVLQLTSTLCRRLCPKTHNRIALFDLSCSSYTWICTQTTCNHEEDSYSIHLCIVSVLAVFHAD
jgi:hypothetical protein